MSDFDRYFGRILQLNHLLKIYTKRDIIEINVDKFLKTKEEIENHVKRFQDLHRNLNL